MRRHSQKIKLEIAGLKFTWDDDKASANERKHGVTFEEAASCWLDPFNLESDDPMKKSRVDNNSLEIPEIPPNAVLRPSRHRPAANARMSRKKVTLALDVDIIAWFESEARRGGLNHNDHINEALRQYIIDLIGDKPASPALSKRQREEVKKLIDETLAGRSLAQHPKTLDL